MNAYDIKIEWDEDGCHLIIDGDSPDPEYQASILDYRVEDPEQLYDRVKAAILPWLMERDQAKRAVAAGVSLEAFLCEPDESAGMAEYAVAVREDGSLRMEPDEDAYDPSDPKHRNFHSVHADLYDSREGK